MHLAEPANAAGAARSGTKGQYPTNPGPAATAAGKPGRGIARFRWRQRSGDLVKRAQWLSIELPLPPKGQYLWQSRDGSQEAWAVTHKKHSSD